MWLAEVRAKAKRHNQILFSGRLQFEVEQATTENVIRLFSLPMTTNTQKKRDS